MEGGASQVVRVVKNRLPVQVKGATGLIQALALGRPWRGHGTHSQYYCLENPGREDLAGYSPWSVNRNTTSDLAAAAHAHGYCMDEKS